MSRLPWLASRIDPQELAELAASLPANEWGEVDWSEFEENLIATARKGRRGESGMRKWYEGKRWTIVGGLPGHRVHSPGPDGFAWKANRKGGLSLHILDNKALRAPVVGRASALRHDRLAGSIGKMVRAMRVDTSLASRPNAARARALLQQTQRAIEDGRPLPSGVSLVVTNAAGKSTGISDPLKRAGVKFRDIAGNRAAARARAEAKTKARRVRR